ncbi:hypothetical protein [Leifsonia xyli]|uniref:hypothetical protein n=1 Tax=Leifsonia xyli TaxID=1575 RepID=UPI0005C5E8FD|nr:hypothetical protein [Leifsonia xyli]
MDCAADCIEEIRPDEVYLPELVHQDGVLKRGPFGAELHDGVSLGEESFEVDFSVLPTLVELDQGGGDRCSLCSLAQRSDEIVLLGDPARFPSDSDLVPGLGIHRVEVPFPSRHQVLHVDSADLASGAEQLDLCL